MTIGQFDYFTRIYHDVMSVNLKFFEGKSEGERSRCKYSCIACIFVLNISFYISNK